MNATAAAAAAKQAQPGTSEEKKEKSGVKIRKRWRGERVCTEKFALHLNINWIFPVNGTDRWHRHSQTESWTQCWCCIAPESGEERRKKGESERERERERMLRSNHWSEEQMKFGVIKLRLQCGGKNSSAATANRCCCRTKRGEGAASAAVFWTWACECLHLKFKSWTVCRRQE